MGILDIILLILGTSWTRWLLGFHLTLRFLDSVIINLLKDFNIYSIRRHLSDFSTLIATLQESPIVREDVGVTEINSIQQTFSNVYYYVLGQGAGWSFKNKLVILFLSSRNLHSVMPTSIDIRLFREVGRTRYDRNKGTSGPLVPLQLENEPLLSHAPKRPEEVELLLEVEGTGYLYCQKMNNR